MQTPILYLHGALGSAAQFDALRTKAPDAGPDYALNLPGHGGQPAEQPFSMPLFEQAVLDFMDQMQWRQVHVFGYSMGGYLGLWLAWKHPERIKSLRTYGTKLNWNPEVAAGMGRMFDPEKIAAKAPALADSLAQTHGAEHWQTLCRRTAAFLTDLGNGLGIPNEAFGQIQCPVTIGWGSLDHVVTEEESRTVANAIPQGRFEILPDGKHLIEQVDVDALARFVYVESEP